MSEQALLSYQLFVRDRSSDLEELDYPRHLAPLNQFYSFANQFAVLGAGTDTTRNQLGLAMQTFMQHPAAGRISCCRPRPSGAGLCAVDRA